MRSSLIFAAMAASCGGSNPKSAPAPAVHTAADLGPLCRAHYAHEQTCADDYLGALIDLRVELDQPPGIAAEAKAKGKPAMVELARVELTRDTAPDKVDAICTAIATKTPPEQVDPLFDEGTHCAAMTDCKAFATCAVATERSYIVAGGCKTADCQAEH
jgi:hypothetical protein